MTEGNAPQVASTKVTTEDLDAEIAAGKTIFTRIEGTTLIHCAIVLANGFTITGESGCADPARFDEELGQRIAFNRARDSLWPLLGWRLIDRSRPVAQRDYHLSEYDRVALAKSGLAHVVLGVAG